MTLVLALVGSVGVIVLFWSLDRGRLQLLDPIQRRLTAYNGPVPVLTLDQIELQKSASERIWKPLAARVSSWVARHTPANKRIALENQLTLAGRPGDLTPTSFQMLRYALAFLLMGAGLVLGVAVIQSPAATALAGGFGSALGYFGPALWVRQRVRERQTEIQKALPDMLDLLTITVEAGLSFDMALGRVSQKMQNALGYEVGQVLAEVRLGRPRLEALDALGRRCGVEDLHNFVQAVVQSEQMGVGVAKILRMQSEEMRRKRKQRAQEKAAQATLKMMLPMVGCIFPTLWIVLLGPAILILLANR